MFYNNYNIEPNIYSICSSEIKKQKTPGRFGICIVDFIQKDNFDLIKIEPKNIFLSIRSLDKNSVKNSIGKKTDDINVLYVYTYNSYLYNIKFFKEETPEIYYFRISNLQIALDYIWKCYNTIIFNNRNNYIGLVTKTEEFIKTHFGKKIINTLCKKYKIDVIENDIWYFKNTGILTSRLAIVMYRIYILDFDSSDTKVGRFFSKIFGKSKPCNDKKHSIKNVKGYKVADNAIDLFILEERVQIATRLKMMNIEDGIISQATGLTINDVRSIFVW